MRLKHHQNFVYNVINWWVYGVVARSSSTRLVVAARYVVAGGHAKRDCRGASAEACSDARLKTPIKVRI